MELPPILTAENNPATATINAGQSESSADAARQRLSGDFNSFMLLLTTQLKNQDPTEPMDTNEFTNQLVLFSGVEQSVQTNANLEKLISISSNQQINNAVAFIGKAVETSGSSGFLQDGVAEFSYSIPPGADSVTIAVLDEQDRPVYSGTGSKLAGKHSFVWDGINSFTGEQMPDGKYKFGVIARNVKEETLDTEVFTTGVVTSVSLDGGDMVLTLNGQLEVPIDKVMAVREAPQPKQDTSPPEDGDDDIG